MNGVVKQRHDINTLDWMERGGSHCQTVPLHDAGAIENSNKTLLCRSGRSFRCRSIQPQDRQIIQQLHEDWFPVLYQDEFFDELVHGRMIGSGDPLFTRLAIDDDQSIAGCVIGSFINANLLAKNIQELLVNDTQRYPRVFYIMTLGCTVRRIGLATTMIEECLNEVEHDELCGVVYLHVITDNAAAIRMYEQLGFYRVQEIENYYSIDDTLHNCFLYAKYYHGAWKNVLLQPIGADKSVSLTGNRGHLTIWKQTLRVFSLLLGLMYVWVSKLRRLEDFDEERRNR